MNIIALLKQDHKKVKELLTSISNTTKRAVKKRKKLFEQIKAELKLHEKIEEALFYPPLKKHSETKDLTFESYEEHALVDYLLTQLEKEEYDADEWAAKISVLKENVEHHIKEEEKKLFPRVKKVISTTELKNMAEKAEQIKKQQKTTGRGERI